MNSSSELELVLRGHLDTNSGLKHQSGNQRVLRIWPRICDVLLLDGVKEFVNVVCLTQARLAAPVLTNYVQISHLLTLTPRG